MICVAIILIVLLMLSACGGGVKESEFDVVKNEVSTYISDRAGNTKASNLQMAIVEGDAPYIVSVRSSEDYSKGHIPGAINMSFSEITNLPKDQEILVYCYTGQSASFAAAVLGVMDYEVQNLLHGMSAWSSDPDVYVKRFSPESHQKNYQIETVKNDITGNYDYPTLDNTDSSDAEEILKAAVATVSPAYITADDLNMKIAEEKDMTIVSVRSSDDYAVGHIPGAINIGLDKLVDNLDKIDPENPVYVYCYTGQSSAQATALLKMLGYDAYSLKFGMCAWTEDSTYNVDKCFDAVDAQDYDIEK
jgi:rhodanese-related sulfurtransferase